MNLVFTLPNLLFRLWRHLERRRQNQFGMLVGLIILSALSEVISLGALIPFLSILTSPEYFFNQQVVMNIAMTWGITSSDQLVLPLTLAFAAAALIAGAIRIILLWVSTRLSFSTGADLGIEVYRRTLYQPYEVHVSRNSSEIISGITNKVDGVVFGVILPFLTLGSSAVLLVAIMLALIVIDPFVAFAAAIGFGTSYALIAQRSRARLLRNSHRIAYEQTQVIKALQEGLGGIRDVLLDGTQPIYCDIYSKADYPLRRGQGNNVFISQSPRYLMEALGMALIAALAFVLSHQAGGISTALPVLGALALGAQRLLPALQQMYSSWASIAGHVASLNDTIEMLEQPLPTEPVHSFCAPLGIRKAIRFADVRYRYSDNGSWVLNGLNLNITVGSRVGFVGTTGSGKSTMLDLLMGLLKPTEGEVLVDDLPISGKRLRAWQRSIAHVPQSIYLADATIAENIAFGVPPDSIDLNRVRKAAAQAQIADFIESRPDGYHAYVGERGIRLSGGQRQRIGIARALYKQASVLVFDEATSALDSATERSVMETIDGLGGEMTVLLIAHRITTVRHCDIIVELESGRMVAKGTYEQLLKISPSFRKSAMVL